MLKEEVAFRAFAAVYTFIILQYVLHIVHSHRIVSLDLATVTANDFHAQAPWDHFAFVSVFEALVPCVAIGFVIQLPPLYTPMRCVWRTWA